MTSRTVSTRDSSSLARGVVAAPHQRLAAEARRLESILQRAEMLLRLLERAIVVVRGARTVAGAAPSSSADPGVPGPSARNAVDRPREDGGDRVRPASPRLGAGGMPTQHARPLARRSRPRGSRWNETLFWERYRDATAKMKRPHSDARVAPNFEPLRPRRDAEGIGPDSLTKLITRFGLPPGDPADEIS